MIEYEDLKKLNHFFLDELKSSSDSVIESGWYILGENVKNFENEFAKYNSNKHCIGVASGLDALILSLKAFDFPEDSEIIVPSNTYIATILAILHCNLRPVLVEPSIYTYNIDPELIIKSISNKTKALLVVNLYGKSCDMDLLTKICKDYNLRLIEDCAQSHGAKYKNKNTGTFGDINAFSFYPTKNLGALGDAGAIVLEDDEYADKIIKLRNYGSRIKYYNDYVGYNSRLDEIQAAFLSVKLKYLDKINDHKRKLSKLYSENLKSQFILPSIDSDYYDVYHIYPIRSKKRNQLREYLLQHGIKTEIHYPVPPHKQKALEIFFQNGKIKLSESKFCISDEIHQTELSLPISFVHSEQDIFNVIEVMNNFN